eukprot:scaffold6588_cov37-Prasinocladus_malaysianus.AAC.1
MNNSSGHIWPSYGNVQVAFSVCLAWDNEVITCKYTLPPILGGLIVPDSEQPASSVYLQSHLGVLPAWAPRTSAARKFTAVR